VRCVGEVPLSKQHQLIPGLNEKPSLDILLSLFFGTTAWSVASYLSLDYLDFREMTDKFFLID